MNTAQGASAAMIGWCSLLERVVGGMGWGRGGMLAGPWSGMVVSQTLSNQLCVDRNYAGWTKSIWQNTTSHPSHPPCQCVPEPNNSNNSLIDNKNFHGDERFALHATTGYKLFLCLHCIFNMNPLSLVISCWSIVSSSCTPPLQFPGLPSNTPPQKQPLWKYQFKYLKIQGMVTVTDTHNNSFTFIHGQIIKPTKRKIAFLYLTNNKLVLTIQIFASYFSRGTFSV